MRGPFLAFLFILYFFPAPIRETGSSSRALANSWHMIPSRSLAGLHYIFKGYGPDEDLGVVNVTGPVIEITGGDHLGAKVHRDGYLAQIDSEDFEEEQRLALAVFEATGRTGASVGTAFLVGNDMVFTNRHVMSYDPTSKERDCGKFSIKLNHREERVECAKVRFCSSDFDFCVIEMKKLLSGDSIGAEVKPLRLTNRVRTDDDTLLLHIGNAAGMGIQASRGKGLLVRHGEFYHYAPTLIGSSGAPIFNEKGEVIGINWGHTGGNHSGDAAFNRGVLAETIYDELLKYGYNKTIKDIKSMRPWWRRTHGQGRKLSISLPLSK